MQYRFLDPGDEKLIETSELPVSGGIAVAVRTTGYNAEEDEVVELAIVDLDGNELFSKLVKPQNKESWEASEASAGIGPEAVEKAPELYQFEEEISALFDDASIVVAAHMPFVNAMIENSWVTLPKYEAFDLIEKFIGTHSASDRPGNPAAVASLDGIAAHYEIGNDGASLVDTARAVARCYKALVKEHADEREAKGAAYWARREEERAQENAEAERLNKAVRLREKNFNRMNGLLWVAAALIFVSLAIQLYQRGADAGFMVVCGAFAVFAASRAVVNFRR